MTCWLRDIKSKLHIFHHCWQTLDRKISVLYRSRQPFELVGQIQSWQGSAGRHHSSRPKKKAFRQKFMPSFGRNSCLLAKSKTKKVFARNSGLCIIEKEKVASRMTMSGRGPGKMPWLDVGRRTLALNHPIKVILCMRARNYTTVLRYNVQNTYWSFTKELVWDDIIQENQMYF